MSLSDYNLSAALNTVISGIPLTPGATPRNSTSPALRQIMADIASLSERDGSAFLGFIQSDANAVAQTVRAKLRNSYVNVADFYKVADGVNADTLALTRALATGKVVTFRGTLTLTSAVTMPAISRLIGEGFTSDNSINGPSRIVRNFTGASATLIMADDCSIEFVDIDGNNQGTGDNLQLSGTRCSVSYVSSRKSGGSGFRVGTTAAGNSNVFQLIGVKSLSNAGHGIYIDAPTDANAGVVINPDCRGNGGDGIKADRCAWTTFVGAVCQANTGYGFRVMTNCRAIHVLGGDFEGNTAGNAVIEAGAAANVVDCSGYGGSSWADNATIGQNRVRQYSAEASKMSDGDQLSLVNLSSAGSGTNMYGGPDGHALASVIAKAFGSGGYLEVSTKLPGGANLLALTIDQLQIAKFQAAIATRLVPINYSASMTLDTRDGGIFQIVATNATAFTINAPVNPVDGQQIIINISNTSGGALDVATFNAVFKLSAWTQPANGFSRAITFFYNGANWIEKSRTTLDVPN